MMLTSNEWILAGMVLILLIYRPVWGMVKAAAARSQEPIPTPAVSKVEFVNPHVSVIAEVLLRIETVVKSMAERQYKMESLLFQTSNHTEKVAADMGDFSASIRRLMREMTGSGGTEDDSVLEDALKIRSLHPEISLEKAVQMARENRVYNRS